MLFCWGGIKLDVIVIGGGFRGDPLDELIQAFRKFVNEISSAVNDYRETRDDYWEVVNEANRKARAWREQYVTALADQLPPPALAIGRSVTPRARRNLPAGIRFRGVGPNAEAAN